MYIVFPVKLVPKTLNISASTSSVTPSFLANNIGAFFSAANGAAANPSTTASCPTNITDSASPASLKVALLTSIAVSNLESPANTSIFPFNSESFDNNPSNLRTNSLDPDIVIICDSLSVFISFISISKLASPENPGAIVTLFSSILSLFIFFNSLYASTYFLPSEVNLIPSYNVSTLTEVITASVFFIVTV